MLTFDIRVVYNKSKQYNPNNFFAGHFMATLYLTANLIKTVFLKRKSIFVVVLVCLLLVNVAVLYSADMLYKLAYSVSDVYYVVDIQNKDYKSIKERLSEFDTDNCFEAVAYFEDGFVLPMKCEVAIFSGRKPANSTEIMVGQFEDSTSLVGTTVELYGKTYNVVGSCSMKGVLVFDFKSLPDETTGIEIRIITKNFGNTKKTIRNLQKAFPEMEIKKVGELNLKRDFLANPLTFLLVGVDFLAVGGLVLCVVYLLTSAEDVLKVYKIQGVTDSRAADVCVFFLLGIMLASAVIAGAIYKILEVLIFAKSGAGLAIAKYMLTFSDMLLVNLLLLAAVMIVYLPFLASTAKKKIEVRENV